MMPTSLINIGRSGLAMSRAGLELSAQNIANANNPDYSRRTLGQIEFVGKTTIGVNSADSLGGVRIGGIERIASEQVQLQARNSAADLSRAEAELSGLRAGESALEQSRLFERLVDFEAALTRLESDPTDATLRTATLETARQLASTFQVADETLGDARALVQSDVGAGVDKVNALASELARINIDLVGSREGSAARASLLDSRDAALRELSSELGLEVAFDDIGRTEIRASGSPGAVLVSGATTNAFAASFAGDGTVSYSVGAQAIVPDSGAMAGHAAALVGQASAQTELDAIALSVITNANNAQASGAAQDGSAGQPFFAGSMASDIAVALASGTGIATAPSGSPPGSRDTTALGDLISAIGGAGGPVAATDELLLGLSSRIAGLDTQREGLSIIAQGAEAALLSETGVDLDTEATNLVRLQQAFEANSRVIQVASELFDTILGLR